MGYAVSAIWIAKDGSEGVLLKALRRLAPLSSEEPGCQLYCFHQDTKRRSVFYLFEIYDDINAFKAHGKSEHFRRLGKGKAIRVLAHDPAAFLQTRVV
jgi:quinol monooxygenase YgiN